MATKRESEKNAAPAKKRGGQFGNRNAYKHGYYTCAYHASELPEISFRSKGLQDDENLLRVMLENYAQKIRPENNLSFKETITALHTVAMTLARLDSLDCKSIRLNAIATPDQDLIDYFKNMGCTDEEIQAEIDGLPPPSQTAKNVPGGQVANTNALKHGFYASIFNSADSRRLERFEKRDINDDMTLLSVLIKRSAAFLFDKKNPLTHVEYACAMRVINFAIARKEKLMLTKALVLGGGTNRLQQIIDEAYESFKYLDPSED